MIGLYSVQTSRGWSKAFGMSSYNLFEVKVDQTFNLLMMLQRSSKALIRLCASPLAVDICHSLKSTQYHNIGLRMGDGR